MRQFRFFRIRVSIFILAAALAACHTTAPISERSHPLTDPENSADFGEQSTEAEIEEIASTLGKYEWTPFTLALVGDAPIPEGAPLPNLESPTEVAYCAFLFERDAFQTRIGSDFSKGALKNYRGFISILDGIVLEPEHTEHLLAGVEGLYLSAIDYARSSSDPQAAMHFNFGNHKGRCGKALSEAIGE